MTFAEILPALLAGKRVYLRGRVGNPLGPIGSDREYFRLPPEPRDTLELVAERKKTTGDFTRYIRRFPLTRFELERDDWEFVDDAPAL